MWIKCHLFSHPIFSEDGYRILSLNWVWCRTETDYLQKMRICGGFWWRESLLKNVFWKMKRFAFSKKHFCAIAMKQMFANFRAIIQYFPKYCFHFPSNLFVNFSFDTCLASPWPLPLPDPFSRSPQSEFSLYLVYNKKEINTINEHRNNVFPKIKSKMS